MVYLKPPSEFRSWSGFGGSVRSVGVRSVEALEALGEGALERDDLLLGERVGPPVGCGVQIGPREQAFGDVVGEQGTVDAAGHLRGGRHATALGEGLPEQPRELRPGDDRVRLLDVLHCEVDRPDGHVGFGIEVGREVVDGVDDGLGDAVRSGVENANSERIELLDVTVQRRQFDGARCRVPNVGAANRFEDAGSSFHVAGQRADSVG